jgi:DNA-binding response OmpR family regulator
MRGSVLIVEDDQDISQIVGEVLSDEGFVISKLADAHPIVIRAEVGRLESDVVLLDGGDATGYGSSWMNAAWMRGRSRPIPVIMFTAHTSELAEAKLGVSERSKKAAFVGFLSKPFDLRVLVETVARIVEDPAVVRDLRPPR